MQGITLRIAEFFIRKYKKKADRSAFFLYFSYCFAPHSGQNLVPTGISFPQLVQNALEFCFAPHSGQNLTPAGMEAPQAEHTAPCAAGADGAAAVLFIA